MIIIFLGIAWLLGLWIASLSNGSPWIWIAAGVATLVLAITLRRKKRLGLVLGIVAFLCLGAGRSESAVTQIDEGHIAHYNGLNDVMVAGLVDDEPELHDRVILLKIKSESIELPGNEPAPVEG